jgi:hypothetical protein
MALFHFVVVGRNRFDPLDLGDTYQCSCDGALLGGQGFVDSCFCGPEFVGQGFCGQGFVDLCFCNQCFFPLYCRALIEFEKVKQLAC